jgi:membrane protein
MLHRAWALIKDMIAGYIADEAMSRGAAVAFYTIFSLSPLLVIATAIAGIAFGQEAAEGAIVDQLRGVMGAQAAEAVEALIRGARAEKPGLWAAGLGVVTLLITSSAVFAELQGALNVIWKAEVPSSVSISYLVKARAASIGLVAATGFLLMVSLVVSAGLEALQAWIGGYFTEAGPLLRALNFLISFGLITALFAAIYKILPDRRLEWRDVLVGAMVTALLFTLGKSAIAWYLGANAVASSYGAAGAFVLVLLWVYYSSQIFLLGAEFTRAWAGLEGSRQANPVPAEAPCRKLADPAEKIGTEEGVGGA